MTLADGRVLSLDEETAIALRDELVRMYGLPHLGESAADTWPPDDVDPLGDQAE